MQVVGDIKDVGTGSCLLQGNSTLRAGLLAWPEAPPWVPYLHLHQCKVQILERAEYWQRSWGTQLLVPDLRKRLQDPLQAC